jgi:hypothetical protein
MPGVAGPIPHPGPHLYAPRSAALGGKGLALFERSEFSQTPPKASTAGSPKRQRRGADSWGAFLWVTFLLRKRTSNCAAGRNSRPGTAVEPCTAATAKPPRGVGARMRVALRWFCKPCRAIVIRPHWAATLLGGVRQPPPYKNPRTTCASRAKRGAISSSATAP